MRQKPPQKVLIALRSASCARGVCTLDGPPLGRISFSLLNSCISIVVPMTLAWKDAKDVLEAASDPQKLAEIAESLSTDEEKAYSRSLIEREKEELLLRPNPRRWVRKFHFIFSCLHIGEFHD